MAITHVSRCLLQQAVALKPLQLYSGASEWIFGPDLPRVVNSLRAGSIAGRVFLFGGRDDELIYHDEVGVCLIVQDISNLINKSSTTTKYGPFHRS